MERPRQKLASFFENLIHPLPDPKKEADRLGIYLKYLSREEAEKILRVVIGEVKKSRKYDLFLSDDLLKKEEMFFLFSLDSFGGIHNIVNNHTFDEVLLVIHEAGITRFEKESKDFFAKFSKRKDGSNLRFGNHLDSTTGALINAIFNKRI